MQKVERPKFPKQKKKGIFGIFKKEIKTNTAITKPAIVRRERKGLNIFRRNQPKQKPKVFTAKYTSVAQQRKKTIFFNRLRDIRVRLPIKTILVVATLVIVIVGLFFLRNSAFNVQEIQVIGPSEVLTQIKTAVEEFKGKNIYLISESEIEKKIKTNVSEIEKIYLYKQLPNTLQIEALAGNPVLILANLNQVSLLDSQARVIGQLGGIQKIDLLEYQEKILKGERDLEAEYIKNKYLEDKTDQEKLRIDWTKVSIEEKTAVYNNLKQESENKVSSYFDSVKEIYAKSVYNDLPLIQSNYIDLLDSKDLGLCIALIDSIASRGVKISKNLLSTKFTLDIYSDDNKLIRLSLQRDLETQIKQLDTIIYYGYFSSAKIIDLRIDTGSITR